MDILAALKREERKIEKHISTLQHQLDGVRAATQVLGKSTGKQVRKIHKRSQASRARMSRAAKKRWRKIKQQAKKVAG